MPLPFLSQNSRCENVVGFMDCVSTNKYVILSYGTFSGAIGYLSFYSQVYSLKYCAKYSWDYDNIHECIIFEDKSNKVGKWIVN